ncbi:MAG: hypothetical protein ACW96N_07090 [Candidatus Thorarchaeota archaeon]|jgi:hypothetical protein
MTSPITYDEELSNEKVLFILHRETSAALYSHEFIPGGLDPQLLSGFVSAMTSFIGTLAGGEQTQWKTEYGEDTVLLVEGGEWAIGVMAISRETNEVRSKLRRIVREFEENYRNFRNFDRIDALALSDFDRFVMDAIVLDRLSEKSVVIRNADWESVMLPIESSEVLMHVMKFLMRIKSGHTIDMIAKKQRMTLTEVKDVVALAFWHNAIRIVYVPTGNDILSLSEGSLSPLLSRDNPLGISTPTMKVIGAFDGRSPLSAFLEMFQLTGEGSIPLELGDLVNRGYVQRISTERRLLLANECVLNELLQLGKSILGSARMNEFFASTLETGVKMNPWTVRVRIISPLNIQCEINDSMSTLDLDDMHNAIEFLIGNVTERMSKKSDVAHIGSALALAKKRCSEKWGQFLVEAFFDS